MKQLRYRREIAETAAILTSHGVPADDLPRLLDIPPERFERWRTRYKELQNALDSPPPVQQAQAALLKRALGFKISEASSEELVDKKSGEILEVLKRRTITKDVPPDVRALLFYLQNFHPGILQGNIQNCDFQPEEDEVDL